MGLLRCQMESGGGILGLVLSSWLPAAPGDSDVLRRKKIAVRSGHMAMAGMVIIAVAGTVVSDFSRASALQIVGLLLAAALYIGWSCYGTRDPVRRLLWEGATLAPPTPMLARWSAIGYFAVQLSLAAAVYSLGDQGRLPNLVWLALLPPVAYSVFLLERRGIAVVSGLVLAILVVNMAYWHGWDGVVYGVTSFAFALVFTLVFTSLTVSAERARWEIQRLVGELREANEKLRQYAVQVEELAATRERNRLAREIHDSLGHYLTVVNVQLQAAQALLPTDPVKTGLALAKAQSLNQEGLQEVRRSVAALRTSPLDHRDLSEALRQLTAESLTGGLNVRLEVLGTPRTLETSAALALYRAAQEGLTNVRKHSAATQSLVRLDFRSPTTVVLEINDNGVGARSNSSSSSGFGLLGLKERTQLLGGLFQTITAPGDGFTLRLQLPT